jgi:hypothetical protein
MLLQFWDCADSVIVVLLCMIMRHGDILAQGLPITSGDFFNIFTSLGKIVYKSIALKVNSINYIVRSAV